MVYRIFVEKRPGLDNEARALLNDAREFLGIDGLEGIRLFNRYDVEGVSRPLFNQAAAQVFSEPQLDYATEEMPETGAQHVFCVEYLPGQFDQRADSAAQCIQILSQGERPAVRTAKVYAVSGNVSEEGISRLKKYVINPVEAREASMEKPETLVTEYQAPAPVETVEGFLDLDRAGLEAFVEKYALAMDADDAAFCQNYFRKEGRNPTQTEVRMLDTYWSDHCRHTTFLTSIDAASFEDATVQAAYADYLAARKDLGRENRPVTLMDLATVAVRCLKKEGRLEKLDESEEINACTVKIDVDVNGETQKWLLLFKNETHNHPTEIEPFGGAATCIGGAIRDPLSGRAYVYGAMRVTGAADPTRPVAQTLPGKLPQRQLTTTAAAGYSSYGNQIGLATGQVDEIYHDGYAAKRMEIGAVIAAAPAANVRRETPLPGDVVILLGGRTGRDGCGGATGSSKSHTLKSLETCGAEVQKGNAPEERKLQRLFRNPEASRLIKRCNDFGAGGVSVAIGELADGLEIDLDKVPKKYEGLGGTELAISESQERMAVVVAPKDAEKFLSLAEKENLEATVVARVTETPRLVMHFGGKTIVDVSREFLNSNGAGKHITVHAEAPRPFEKEIPASFRAGMEALAGDLNVCSRRGLAERFDSTIGAGAVLMPFGGRRQLTPVQAMVQKISLEKGDTGLCSLMAWGYNPYIAEKSPFHGAYLAVVESVSRLVATGAKFEDVYLTFQEYFEKPGRDPKRWGKPLSALLGAYRAQRELSVAAIGGKDSMSGSFEKMDVPPTLVSFAVTTERIANIVSDEFKAPDHRVALLTPEYGADGLPTAESLKNLYDEITQRMRRGEICAAYTPGYGGCAEAVLKMSLGNGLGFDFECGLKPLFGYCYGGFVVECTGESDFGRTLGRTAAHGNFTWQGESVSLAELEKIYENRLEKVFPAKVAAPAGTIPTFSCEKASSAAPIASAARPTVLIPVFPGTNCEYDSAKAVEAAGAKAEILVINNLTSAGVARSVENFAQALKNAQAVFIPGGFSGGDEPDGSAKLIAAFFRSPAVREQVTDLMDRRGGLMLGVCNGFQALIKLGLVPFGKIVDTDVTCPTLTFNTIGRHQSRLVRTRVASAHSPWLKHAPVGSVYTVPISHGEGRFMASEEVVARLAANGQIATQYVDLQDRPTDEILFNPNGSACAIEGILSPDGRVLGKMGHSERIGSGLYRNVPGEYDMQLFRSAVEYFK